MGDQGWTILGTVTVAGTVVLGTRRMLRPVQKMMP